MKKTIAVGSDFSGIGAFDESLKRLKIPFKNSFVCDSDKYARKTFIENNGTESDKKIVNSKEHDLICNDMLRVINGTHKFNDLELLEFLERAEILARSFSFYYPLNVEYRSIPETPLGIYMTSPPCQGFSMAGKRKGSNLFMNSLNFIDKNKPRFFIFENVKGLHSHEKKDPKAEYGRTFNLWLNYLGGKSINGVPVVFPYDSSVPYHIYHTVLNAKDFNIPQNRERVFIIGIRDDIDNVFSFTPGTHLKTKLKDVLESVVDDKYYLSDEMIKGFIKSSEKHDEKGMFSTLCSGTHGYANGYVKIGAIRGRNPENPKSRVSGLKTKQMLEINESGTTNTLTTVQKDNVVIESGVWRTHKDGRGFRKIKDGSAPTIAARAREDGSGQPVIKIKDEKHILNYKIRRLTPRECIRLMDFRDSFKLPCSDTQTYKQAGNSIVVAVLISIIKKFKL